MIKSTPYRYFTILMAFVVLLSSTGFGMVEHSCMMRGKSVELGALKNAETACGMCKPTTISTSRALSIPQFNKKACCEETQKHQKIDVLSSSSAFSKILKSLPFSATLGDHTDSPLGISLFAAHTFLLPSLPPLLLKSFGRGMLVFVQSFLI